MSRTLFWYVLKDLIRVFLMAVAVLAGIMSFGGLLKPLTEHGLSAGQAVKILLCFLPATQTYALPIAALFATTTVYGRLAADNELTACRASGISYLALTMPALVLGLSISILSLLCLCFVAPHFMLKAEKVVFSNIAEVVKNKVERSHLVALGNFSICANSAELPPVPEGEETQQVILHGVTFVTYEADKGGKRGDLPKMFYTAESARAFIRQDGEDVSFVAVLHGGMKIDRQLGTMFRADSVDFGPVSVPSPIRERTQFMDIRRLKDVSLNPHKSRNVREVLDRLLQSEVEEQYAQRILAALNRDGQFTFQSEMESLTLHRGDPLAELRNGEVVAFSRAEGEVMQTQLVRRSSDNPEPLTDKASSAEVQVEAAGKGADARLNVTVTLRGAMLDVGAGASPPRERFSRSISLPMPRDLATIQEQSLQQYLAASAERNVGRPERFKLKELDRVMGDLMSRITTETHGRAAFALSCLILVLVGCALGMLFKSGDFITAFALSAIPAILSIAMVSTGQHVGESDPKNLSLGIGIIWSSNAIIMALVVALLTKLQRQ